MNLKKLIYLLLILIFSTSVFSIDLSWTVTKDNNLKVSCPGSYALPEDIPGWYDMVVFGKNNEEFPITSYPIFPNEVFTMISCSHEIEFTSSEFISNSKSLILPIRYRKSSGSQILIKLDDNQFKTIGVVPENKDCYDDASLVSRNDNYKIPFNVADNKSHTISIKILDRDKLCNDLTQVWFSSRLFEKNEIINSNFEDIKGIGVSYAEIVTQVSKALFSGELFNSNDNEDLVITTQLGQVYGFETPTPLPKKKITKIDILNNNNNSNSDFYEIENLSENYFDVSNIKPNNYEIIKVKGNPEVAHFIDIYGNEKYTTDGKNFYKNYGKAIHPGLKGIWTSITKIPSDFSDFLFKTKLKDKDKELQREISREVLSDFKSEDELKRDKISDELSKKILEVGADVLPGKLSDLAQIPANSIKNFAKEADETEFAQGVMFYIEERKSGKSFNNLYENPTEELIYGGLKGVSVANNVKYPKALLYNKYEESYQRYLLAKQLGRKE